MKPKKNKVTNVTLSAVSLTALLWKMIMGAKKSSISYIADALRIQNIKVSKHAYCVG